MKLALRRDATEQTARGWPGARRALVVLLLVACARIAHGDLGGEKPAGEAVGGSPPEAKAPRRILVLSSYGTDFALFNQISNAIRSELAQSWQEPFDIYEVALEHARIEEEGQQAAFLDYLSNLFSIRRPALVVVLGGPATRFAVRHREQFFREVPLLYAAADADFSASSGLGANDASAPTQQDLSATVEAALELMPETEHLVLVLGSSPIEKYWRDRAGRDLARFEERLSLTWLDGLSLGEIRERVAVLPRRSAVFFLILLVDGAGVPHSQTRALAAIRQASSAPVFGLFDNQVGEGVVGGPSLAVGEIGIRVAEAASRLLRGESPAAVRYPPLRPTAFVYDGRELERWGLPESRLPPGSTVRYRVPSLWDRYRWQLLGGVSILGLQTALIAGLVIHRARRRSAEGEVRQLHGRLLAAYELERRRLARELHDDVTQRLARLAIDGAQVERLGATGQGAETLRQMRVELGRLGHDVHALSRRLHPSILDDLGLAEAVRSEAGRLERPGSVAVALRFEDVPAELPAELGLCLFRIAQEALRNVEHHARATRVEVALKGARGGVELTVRDDGVGFDPDDTGHRQGLGRVSMRERLALFGGRLSIESAAGRGTTVTAWVPLEESAR